MFEMIIVIIVLLAIFAVPITALILEERLDPPAWEEVDTKESNKPEITKEDDPTKALEYLNKYTREIVKEWSAHNLSSVHHIYDPKISPLEYMIPSEYHYIVFPRYSASRRYAHISAYHKDLVIPDVYTDNYLEAIDGWVKNLWNENHNPESEYQFNLSEEEIAEVRQRVLFRFLIDSAKSPIAQFIHDTFTLGSSGISPGHLVMVDAIEEVVYNKTLERLVAYTTFLPKPHFFQLAQTNYPELIMELIQEFKENRQ